MPTSLQAPNEQAAGAVDACANTSTASIAAPTLAAAIASSGNNPSIHSPSILEPSTPSPQLNKHTKRQHGIKNKSTKKTKVSHDRPRTHEERESLKKPGKPPNMFAYLSLPPGRPKKISDSSPSNSNTANHSNEAATKSHTQPPLPKPITSRGSYKNYDKGDQKNAKAIVLQGLALHGNVTQAIADAQKKYSTVIFKRQTVNSWLKKFKTMLQRQQIKMTQQPA